MNSVFILPTPYEVLDPAIAEILSSFVDGFVNFQREDVTPNSSKYHLRQDQLGDVGEIRIRRLLNDNTELFFLHAKSPPSRHRNDEESALLQSESDPKKRRELFLSIGHKIDAEKDTFRKKRAEHLTRIQEGVFNHLRDDPFIWKSPTRSEHDLEKVLDGFCEIIKSDSRMLFWENKNKKHQWVSNPEKLARHLLLMHIKKEFREVGVVLPEISTGAGRIDLFIHWYDKTETIIEIKLCGYGYSSTYAAGGSDQIHHYMDNRKAQDGYLIVFDARSRDFGKKILSKETASIVEKIIDVRPYVKSSSAEQESANNV